MNDGIEFARFHQTCHGHPIPCIDLVKVSFCWDRPAVTAVERVHHCDAVPGCQELMGSVRPDIAGAAGNQHCLGFGTQRCLTRNDQSQLYRRVP